MTNTEKIILIEEQAVIKNVKLKNGNEIHISDVENDNEIASVEAIPLDEYEANGYDDDGIKGIWIDL